MSVAFLPLIQREVQDFMMYWNTHHIRPSHMALCPSGRPDDMFDMPQLYGMIYIYTYYRHVSTRAVHEQYILWSVVRYCFLHLLGGQNCLHPLNDGVMNYAQTRAISCSPPYNESFFDRCCDLVSQRMNIDLTSTLSPSDCINVYKYLVNNFRWTLS